MLRIGMIGSENSHSKAVSKLINVEKKIRGAKVVAVWGETKAFAQETAEAGQIPTIVKKPEDMLGMVDGVMIDHRHGKYHLPAAMPFVDAGIPVFVDKPLCCSLAEGKRFLKKAKAKGVPVTSFSLVPRQKSFVRFRDEVAALEDITVACSSGPCDIKSKYGGIFFYGIHQVDCIVELLGMGAKYAEMRRGRHCGVGLLHYADGKIVTLNFLSAGAHNFQFAVHGKQILQHVLERDKHAHLVSTKMWIDMMRTGKEPIEHRRMLAPIAVLEALDKALKTGKKVRVGKF